MGVKVKVDFDKNKLERAIKEQAVSALHQRTYDVVCPHCKNKINIPAGKSVCPHCHKEVDLNLNINFTE